MAPKPKAEAVIIPDPAKIMSAKAEDFEDALVKGLNDALDHVLGSVPGPPTPSRAPMTFVSQKQRRYVMMLVAEGKVPYKRTNKLAGSITTEVKKVSEESYLGMIGTNRVYAPWVISSRKIEDGRGPQAEYHKGVWYTLQDVVSKEFSKVVDIIRDAIGKV